MSSESDENGRVMLAGHELSYTGEYGDWTMTVESIRVVAEEHTGNPEDPWSHMVVFVATEEMIERAPVTALGMQDVLRRLAADWESELLPRLGGEGDYRTTIMHPKSLRGLRLATLPEAEKDPDEGIPGLPHFEVLKPGLCDEVKAYLRLF